MPERVHTKFDEAPSDHSSQDRLQTHSSTLKARQKRPASESYPKLGRKVREHNGGSASTPSVIKKSHKPEDAEAKRKSAVINARPVHRNAYGRNQRVEVKDDGCNICVARAKLPIRSHQKAIAAGLNGDRDVMLVSGQTGSGKSTQVPQFLLQQDWCRGCIAVTQPRRVAAISLARRVAQEMHTTLGSSSPASKVGYSVRFDSSVAPAVRVKYLTEGMLLQEMLRDPELNQYSAVVVDEVHERSVNVDLILGFLKRLRAVRRARDVPLKVVVMSATADIRELMSYFDDTLKCKQGGDDGTSQSDSSWSGFSDSENDSQTKHSDSSKDATITSSNISVCNVQGRQHPVEMIYLPESTADFVETALETIIRIHYGESLPGDILIFLPGQDTIEALEGLLNEKSSGLEEGVPKLLVLPLFAALSRTAQDAIFKPTPPHSRKVIISTNIAETSVTIPGIRHVIDSGLAKVKEFRSPLGLDSLLIKPISKSAAIQRRGRAGREAPGKCYALYTEQDYNSLEYANIPEILKCDVASAVLIMKARNVDDVTGFPFLSPPDPSAMRQALVHLYRLNALDDSGRITQMGRRMARLPLAPSLSRVLIAAAELDSSYLLDVIDIVAAFSVEKLFIPLLTEEEKEDIAEARKRLFRREGDHLTMLAIIQAYAAEQTDRRTWADERMISHMAMRNVMNIRKQLRAQCVQLKLLDKENMPIENNGNEERHTALPERAPAILKCFMKGFAPNTARLMPDGSYRTVEGNHLVAIHPSSVLFGRKVEAILYTELVFTVKNYARGVSAAQLDWYASAVGL